MPTINKCFKADSSILNVKVLEDGNIIFATSNSGIRVVDAKEYSVVSNILPKELTPETSLTVFSKDSRLVAFVNKNRVFIMLLKTQAIIKIIDIPNENIEIIDFDLSSTYIIIGTNRGRVLQYRFNSCAQLSRLCSFPYLLPDESFSQKEVNYVSAFAFHKEKFACSGYGGAIYVINLYSRANTQIITRIRARSRIEALYFLNDKCLISGNSDGVIEIISLEDTSKIKRLNAPFLNIKSIIAMPNKDYILVSSNKNYISLINCKTLKVVENRYLEFDAPVDTIVQKDEESFLIVLQDATFFSIELEKLSHVKLLIDNHKIYEAYQFLQNAPMLRGSKENSYLDECFAQTLKVAVQYLIKGDMHSADKITRPLLQIAPKRNEVELIYTAFKHYEKFQILFHEKRYALVYSMSDRYPALKETKEYKSVEKFWKKSFIEAQKQMQLNNLQGAKALLQDYIMVPSKRTLIKNILYKNKEFIEFLHAIEDKEFAKLNEIVRENKDFTHLDNYQSLQKEMQESVHRAKELINIGNIDHAESIIQRLEKVLQYEKTASQLREMSQNFRKLKDAFQEDNLFLCYKLMDANDFLKESDLGKQLEEKWNKKIKVYEKYAIMGLVDELLVALGDLLKLSSRRDRIGDLLRLAYRIKIKSNLKKAEYKRAKELILYYIDNFGLDVEIKNTIKMYVKQSSLKFVLTRTQSRRKPQDFWLYSKVTQ